MTATLIEATAWVKHTYIGMFERMQWVTRATLLTNDSTKPYMRGTYRLLVTSEEAFEQLSIYCSGPPDRTPHGFFIGAQDPPVRTYATGQRRRVHIRTTP